ncbi:MAG TPA: fluoride efflux transporter CrcB [Alphaproteobacteria bacterium]|nr:fluoride efflux transporter CrcB [Alphaproteobacteria bacterium]
MASFWIAVGGAIGSVLRFWVAEVFARAFGTEFPWGTVFANVSGCFVIGFFATLTGPEGRVFAGPLSRQFVMIGICGGYTTFSSFSLQTLALLQTGDGGKAALNVGMSLVLCLLAVWIGHVAAGMLNQMNGA